MPDFRPPRDQTRLDPRLPGFVQPQDYSYLPKSVDELFASIRRGRELKAARERQSAIDLASTGVDWNAATPEDVRAVMEGRGGVDGLKEYIEREKAKRGRSARREEAEIADIEAKTKLSEAKAESEKNKPAKGTFTPERAAAISQQLGGRISPEAVLSLGPGGFDAIRGFGKIEAAAQKAKDRRAELKLTPGQKKLDETFAKDFAAWVTGGFADAQKGVDQISNAVEELKRSDKLTGPIAGSVPFRDVFNPKSADIQASVEEVVQRNLRLILGAQFTEREGVRLIERAFNPRLEESKNIVRLNRLMKQMSDAANAKNEAAEFFEKHGTLKGFKGKLVKSAAEFLSEFRPAGSEARLSPAKQKRLEELRRKRGQ